MDSMYVRLIDPRTGELLREHLGQKRGGHRIRDEDRPKRTPQHTHQLLARAHKAGSQHRRRLRRHPPSSGRGWSPPHPGHALAGQEIRQCGLRPGLRAALELGVSEYQFVRRYLERSPQAPLSLRQIDPLIRRTDSVSRRDPTTNPIRGTQTMNLIELNRSLVQLRLSGMAAVLETRLLQAQSEAMAPIDLISILVSDELACRSKRLLDRRHKQAQFA